MRRDDPVLAAPRLYGVDCAVPHGAAHRRLRRVAEREAEPAVSAGRSVARLVCRDLHRRRLARSEEHTSELQSLMRITYAVLCLKKKINTTISASHRKHGNITNIII